IIDTTLSAPDTITPPAPVFPRVPGEPDRTGKTASPAQIDANRRNARKSTGPQTPEGRAASKMNALKHGILSRQVLVNGHNLKENDREFMTLHKRFWMELNPVGPLEEMLVDQIVTTHWRRRRALQAESGEIALSVDQGKTRRRRARHTQSPWLDWQLSGDQALNMEETAMGNRILCLWLQDLRQAVARDGELTPVALQQLLKKFGDTPNTLTLELERLRLDLQKNPEALDAAALRERNRQRALAFLDQKLTQFEQQSFECEARAASEERSLQAAAVLPSLDVLEKIMRYETRLERQLFRAMTQLERLQRLRLGDCVAAPLSV